MCWHYVFISRMSLGPLKAACYRIRGACRPVLPLIRLYLCLLPALFALQSPGALAPSGPEGTPQTERTTAESGSFRPPHMWEYSAPLIAPESRKNNPSHAQKDPSVVFYEG